MSRSRHNLEVSISGRRGSIYVFVLGAATLLGVVGVALLTTTQISVRASSMTDDAAEASVLAESAVEFALLQLVNDPNWRSTYTSNVESSPKSLGHGTMSFKIVDEVDGNLANSTLDAARVYGIGRVNRSTRVYSVNCGQRPVSSLQAAMSFGGAVTLGIMPLTGTGTLSSNTAITCTSTTLNSVNLEAAGIVTRVLTTGSGAYRSAVAAKQMPDSSAVFNYYVTNGTQMTNVSTSGGSGLQINRVLISPTNNPYSGGANVKGIYVVNCGGSDVYISDVRIVGTLVLRNAGQVYLQSSVIAEPAVLGYPVLMVQGNLNWQTDGSVLQEGTSPTVNCNPASTPYPYNYGQGGGSSNSSNGDSYPNRISGIVYVTGSFASSNSPSLHKGVLICPSGWTPGGAFDLTFDDTYYNNPAPGFGSGALMPLGGTWRWEQAP